MGHQDRGNAERGSGVMSTKTGDQPPRWRAEVLRYDYEQKRGELHIQFGYCETAECLRLFEAIDPEVRAIDCFYGGDLDARYRRTRRGWKGSLYSRRSRQPE